MGAGIARRPTSQLARRFSPNENGSAPGLYLKANINPAIPPDVFVLPAAARASADVSEICCADLALSSYRPSALLERLYRIAGVGQPLVEEAIGKKFSRFRELSLVTVRGRVKSKCGLSEKQRHRTGGSTSDRRWVSIFHSGRNTGGSDRQTAHEA